MAEIVFENIAKANAKIDKVFNLDTDEPIGAFRDGSCIIIGAGEQGEIALSAEGAMVLAKKLARLADDVLGER